MVFAARGELIRLFLEIACLQRTDISYCIASASDVRRRCRPGSGCSTATIQAHLKYDAGKHSRRSNPQHIDEDSTTRVERSHAGSQSSGTSSAEGQRFFAVRAHYAKQHLR